MNSCYILIFVNLYILYNRFYYKYQKMFPVKEARSLTFCTLVDP